MPGTVKKQENTHKNDQKEKKITYKNFTLDSFQEKAIASVELGHSTVVSAPTGCGKTLIAEYLIEKSLAKNEKIIYTAPIKALSNQKYRDFSSLYPEKVGILTGDIIINPSAPVLIMTTEIFRNMLFSDMPALENTKAVIFDEIHFINDIERGVIWEESIIFSPHWMRFLCLSATIPNAQEFCDWIEKIKGHPVDLIYHEKRPVPLEHLIFQPNGAIQSINDYLKTANKLMGSEKIRSSRQSPVPVVAHLKNNRLLPCIYFAFSRARTLDMAEEISNRFDFTNYQQKQYISELFEELSERYDINKLSAFDLIKKATIQGIGVHNAGIIPPIKELIEKLFSKSLLKLLFVTETFAVGVNMPARSVVFDSLEKYDGYSFRYLMTREYYQMAGRAGRRGMDKEGTVISLADENSLDPLELKRLSLGKSEPLESQFQLSYNTVLNLSNRYTDEEALEVLSQSFAHHQQNIIFDNHKNLIEQKKAEIERLTQENLCDNPKDGRHYLHLEKQAKDFENELYTLKKLIRSTPKKLKKKIFSLKKQALQLEKTVNNIYKKMRKKRCKNCEHSESCLDLHRKMIRTEEEIQLLKNRQENMVGQNIDDLYRRKKNFLKAYGYIDPSNDSLAPKGIIASQIYGYEMVATELIFTGLLEESTPEEIAVISVCTAWEGDKKGYRPKRVEKGSLKEKLRKSKRMISNVRKIELAHEIPLTRFFAIDPGAAAEKWVNGESLHSVMKLVDTNEGDFIRLMRQAIDFLRQIKRVASYDASSSQKLKSAINLLNRDVVQACEDFEPEEKKESHDFAGTKRIDEPKQ